MSNATMVNLAAGVTALLNSASLSQSFTASRCYIPNYEIENAPGLQLFVLGYKQQLFDIPGGDRANTANTYTITVAIYNQLQRDSNGQIEVSQMDAMLFFVSQVVTLFITNNVLASGALVGIKNQPVFDPAALDKSGTFTSVLELDYLLYE